MKGFVLSAPSSGSGKTTLTLGLLRALRNAGHAVAAAKSGPDYIDPRFHEAACGKVCFNLDAWAMPKGMVARLATVPDADVLVIEGAMGLFDGAPPDNRGATADLAKQLSLPVVLVVDAARMAGSVAPLVAGFAGFDPEVQVSGIILNNVGSDRHEAMLRRALGPLGLPVVGAVRRSAVLATPSRHLGLVQAEERSDLSDWLDRVAAVIATQVDLAGLLQQCGTVTARSTLSRVPPPAQRIAVARDVAFAFHYPHMLYDWRAQGAEVCFFSPLADDPVPDADLVYLPGGYPELHAGRIASNRTFMQSIKKASQETDIYGECGGYMILGDGLIDAEGQRHEMAGLLRLETSFATRKLHLGYRDVTAKGGRFTGDWAAHEFHYATTLRADGAPLFAATDAEATALPDMGLIQGRVAGSFAHLIAPRTNAASVAPVANRTGGKMGD